MRINSTAVQNAPERLQVAATERTSQTQNSTTAEEPGLRIELSPEATQALKTGADPTQASSSSAELQTYQRSGATTESAQAPSQVEAGSNRAPPIQDWSVDFASFSSTPPASAAASSTQSLGQAQAGQQAEAGAQPQELQAPEAQDLSLWEPSEATTQSDDAATGRNVGAIYLQNAATGPQEPITPASDTAAGVEARPTNGETQTADAVQQPAEV